MSFENAIEVRDVYKTFKFHKDKSNELKNIILLRNLKNYERKQVLNGISFNVKKGEAIGLVGRNGCGKSTTLKLLTRILRPNKGSITINGRVSSLIELGAGFHPDMTGRENIYINASIFGIKKKEIDARLEEIIRFSEIEDFIDSPVRTYSSGMYMRLAFAVAINVDADILLIDEILAVGDAAFQAKCFNKLRELKAAGTTIVIVSHSIHQVENFCDRAIWIDSGVIREEGDVRMVCRHYLENMDDERLQRDRLESELSGKATRDLKESCKEVSLQCGANARRHGDQLVHFTDIKVCDGAGAPVTGFYVGDRVNIRLSYRTDVEAAVKGSFYVGIVREDRVRCYENSTKREFGEYVQLEESGEFEYIINSLKLLPGKYAFEFRIYGEKGQLHDELVELIPFRIHSESVSEAGILSLDHSWILPKQ